MRWDGVGGEETVGERNLFLTPSPNAWVRERERG